MKAIKKIVHLLLLATLACGVTGLKSVAYCCGNCGHEEVQYEEIETCCHQSAEKQTSDCQEGNYCKVLEFKFDWTTADAKFFSFPSADSPVYFLPVLFFSNLPEVYAKKSFDENAPPPFNLHPRKYLSFIRVLLI